MDFENKILSREISQFIWEKGKTLGTAESCTGGRIAEAIVLIHLKVSVYPCFSP